MGDYISQSDLVELMSYQRIKMLTDDPNSKAVVAATVTKAIVAAEGEVNSFVGKQYDTPIVAPIPEPVRRWATVLASLFLYQRRPPVPDDIKEEAIVTRAQLKELATGGITLDIDDSGVVESDGFEPEFDYETRNFTRSKYDGW